jgi:hypothetical protein
MRSILFFLLDDLNDASKELASSPLYSLPMSEDRAFYFGLQALFLESKGDYSNALTHLQVASYLAPQEERYLTAQIFLRDRLNTNAFWLKKELNQKPPEPSEETLLDKQIDNLLLRAEKLIQEKSYFLAWQLLKELESKNTLLFARAISFLRARIVLAVDPNLSDMSLQFLNQSEKTKALPRYSDETLLRFKTTILEAEKNRLDKQKKIEKWKLENPARDRALDMLLARYPESRRLPLSEKTESLFDLQTDGGYETETDKSIKPVVDLPPAQLIAKRGFKNGVFFCSKQLRYDRYGRPSSLQELNRNSELIRKITYEYDAANRLWKEWVVSQDGNTNFYLLHEYSASEGWKEKITLFHGEEIIEVSEINEGEKISYLPGQTWSHRQVLEIQDEITKLTTYENNQLLLTENKFYQTTNRAENELLKKEIRDSRNNLLESWLFEYNGNRITREKKVDPSGKIIEEWVNEWKEMLTTTADPKTP